MTNICVNNLNHSYDNIDGKIVQILQDINFEVSSGEFVVILGESGCGKSTILNFISGLSKPSNGNISVDGKRLVNVDPSISMLFQNSVLLPWKNVRDNISFGCKIRGDLENLEERITMHIELMGLCQYQSYYPQELSVGTAKRVDLARALIGNPKVLLLDEPFAPLDYYLQKKLQNELIYLWMESGMSCVFVSHDLEEAISLAQKVIIMSDNPGKIENTIMIPLEYPRDPTSKEFLEIKKEMFKQFGLAVKSKNGTDNSNVDQYEKQVNET